MEPIESADPLSYGFRARFEFRFLEESDCCLTTANVRAVFCSYAGVAEGIDSGQRVIKSSIKFHRG